VRKKEEVQKEVQENEKKRKKKKRKRKEHKYSMLPAFQVLLVIDRSHQIGLASAHALIACLMSVFVFRLLFGHRRIVSAVGRNLLKWKIHLIKYFLISC
jgi:hypothetical protein